MARAEARFVCQQCGTAHPKWAGRCDACGAWNSLVEEAARESAPKGLGRGKGKKLAFVGLEGTALALPRRQSGIAEFDRVCGGGMVPGSALLVGGDPGIGKSTVLLQVMAALAAGRSSGWPELRAPCHYRSRPSEAPSPRCPRPRQSGRTRFASRASGRAGSSRRIAGRPPRAIAGFPRAAVDPRARDGRRSRPPPS